MAVAPGRIASLHSRIAGAPELCRGRVRAQARPYRGLPRNTVQPCLLSHLVTIQLVYCDTKPKPFKPFSHNTPLGIAIHLLSHQPCCNTPSAYCNTPPGHNTVQCIAIHSCLKSFPSPLATIQIFFFLQHIPQPSSHLSHNTLQCIAIQLPSNPTAHVALQYPIAIKFSASPACNTPHIAIQSTP